MFRTKPPSPKRPVAAASSSSSAKPPRSGAVGSSSQWKPRCDDDIPSEDSDPGDKVGVKSRTRVRKHIPKRMVFPPGGMSSWMSQSSRRLETGYYSAFKQAAPTSNASTVIEEALFSPPLRSSPEQELSQMNKPSDPTLPSPLSKSTEGDDITSSRNNENVKSPENVQRESQQLDKSKPPSSNMSRPVASMKNGQVVLVDTWKVYTVWFPAWDLIWKCKRKVPLAKNHEFCRLINKVVANTAAIQSSFDMNVLTVEQVFVADSYKDEKDMVKIRGVLQKRPNYDDKSVGWVPYPKVVNSILKTVTTPGDIIVQCMPTGNPSRKPFTVHITRQNGKKLNFGLFSNIPEINVTFCHINYEHYSPLVAMCVPKMKEPIVLLERLNLQGNGDNSLGPQSERNQGSLLASSSKDLHSSSVLQSNSTTSRDLNPSCQIEKHSTSSTPMEVEVTENENDRSAPESAAPAMKKKSQENEIDEVVISDGDDSDNEPGNVQPPNSDLSKRKLVPGPLKPRVTKTDRNVYVYTKLAVLQKKLDDSVSKDVENCILPNAVLSGHWHVHVLVDEIIPQHNKNAYHLLVSDDTQDSVFLRLYTSDRPGLNGIGPEIEVGNIIRVHRATVQDDWDVDKNRMLLTTFSHVNYTLFDKSDEENEFYYNTCAKTISMDDYDLKRIEELYRFKNNRPPKRNKSPETLPQPNIIKSGDRDVNDPSIGLNESSLPAPVLARNIANDSEGLRNSDIFTPEVTNATGLSPGPSQHDFPQDDDNDRVRVATKTRSNESYNNATSQLMKPEAAKTANAVQVSIHRDGSQQEPEIRTESETSLKTNKFLNFKDLVRTDNPVDLLFKVVSVCESTTDDVWRVIIRDVEDRVPPNDFLDKRIPQNSEEDLNLVLTITNGRIFEDRDIFLMLYADIGSEEIYSVRNVRMKGDTPPYTLEVDGKICEIERFPYFLGLFGDSFTGIASEENPFDGGSSSRIDNFEVTHHDNETDNPSSHGALEQPDFTNSMAEVNTSGQLVAVPMKNNVSLHVLCTSAQSDNSSSSSQSCVSISNTNSGGKRQYNTSATKEPWTGRLRNKRKPRENYQPEDSFDC